MIQNMTNWKDQHELFPTKRAILFRRAVLFLFLKLISLVRG